MKEPKKIISVISSIRESANNLIISELKKENITGLAPSHGAILNALLKSKENLKMNDLAEIIGKDKSTVTALINKLVKLGYCQRVKSEVDSRITYISLTPVGASLKPIFYAVSEKLISTAYANFTTEESQDLMDKLEKVMNNFNV